ncbi:long-chain acyl-CoA synthetase [Mobiluncus mulieris]|uniref:Long-chain-fatty-acid--CoA ligase n=1 Tax=Mobiluncus mulieris TaxID=2052 RepID=A0A8G2HTX7_9ACTO|nr:AMP-binding protein [Mobiluncus mulieris]MBB5846272.1 long-chain acyl-CoA synthetase [Mobiluncus mulieris]MCV0010901.1 AMP-binding protein [Mobiluncus mulieris]PNL43892.1 long-chain fatty acid--CoA ligase [Mobiluncus mulieris]STO17246.1 Long-chain-fatty-acid--CoA ligase [Mobiluncus mulieris]
MTDTVDLLGLAPAAGIHLPRYVHTPPENDSELTKRMRELYDPKVPRQVPITDELLIDMLRRISNKYPRRVALDFFGATTSYRELVHRVQLTAALLRERGVERGDRVSLVAPNCPQFIYVLYACLQVGAVAVLHNPLATPVELKWQFENAEPKLIFAWQKTAVTIREVAAEVDAELISIDMARALPRHLRFSLQLPVKKARDLRSQMCDAAAKDLPDFNDLLAHCKPFNRITRVDPDIPAVLLHTGGTTGKPKAVILTNRNLVSNLWANTTWVTKLREGQETWYCVLPFFHAFGLTLSLNGNLALGGTAVLFPKFDVEGILRAQRRRPGTFIVGVPPIFDRLAKAAVNNPKVNLRSFSYAISGAMPLTEEVAKRWENTTGGYLIEGYGMTETSPTVLGSPMSPDRRLGYMGIVFPSIQVRVVDPESNQDVEPGQIGELIVKGPGCSPGYWRDQVETDLLFTADGWLKTGDLVEENDCFLKMSDRRKELIIISGFNVYPSVVETAIASMPQVQEVAAVGIPDQVDAARGEQVHAAIVLKPGASLDLDKVRSWVSEVLPRYAMPRSVSFPESLEKNQMGKIQRRKVRDSVLKELS